MRALDESPRVAPATAPAPRSAGGPDAVARDLLDTPQAGVAAIRGGAVRIGGYAAVVAVGVVSSALLLRHLGVNATGEYVTVLSLVTLVGGVVETGLAAIGVRELSTLAPTRARSFFADIAGLRLACIVVGVLLAAGFAAASGYSATLIAGTLLAGAGFVLVTAQTTYTLPLIAAMRLGWVTAVELVRGIGTTVVIVALVLAGAPLLPFWAATIPPGLAAAALGALLIRRSMPLTPTFHRDAWAPILRRTLPYSLAAAVGAIYFRTAILIMSHVSTPAQTGYYGASFRIIEVLFIAPQLIVGSTLPIFARAARDDRGRLDYSLGRTFDVCLLAGLAVGLALITGATSIIRLIAGPSFAPAAEVLRIQGVALIATFTGALFAYALLSLGRYRELLRINLLVLLASAALTSVLASAHGAVGAASATTIVEIAYTGLLAAAVLRTGTRPQLSLVRIPRAALAALLGALALVPAGLPSIARPALALAIYGTCLLLFAAVPDELLEQMPSRLRFGRADR